MHEMAINIEKACAIRLRVDDMVFPDFIIESAGRCGVNHRIALPATKDRINRTKISDQNLKVKNGKGATSSAAPAKTRQRTLTATDQPSDCSVP
jgi:hypothetical protein